MNSNASTDTTTSADAISRRAYELWEQAGRPDGNDLGHWLQAEKELSEGRGSNAENARYTDQPQSRPTASDTRPLQGQGNRPPASSNREGRRGSSQNPFSGDKAPAGGGVATATKRRA